MNGPPPTNHNPNSGPPETAREPAAEPQNRMAGTGPGPRPSAPLPGQPFDPASIEPGSFFERLRKDKNLAGFLGLVVVLTAYCAFELGGIVESSNRQPVPFGPLPTSLPSVPDSAAGAGQASASEAPPSPLPTALPTPTAAASPGPTATEAAGTDEVETGDSDTSSRRTKSGKAPTAVVDLNTADVNALETLPGVGPKTAQKILDYRKAHDGFNNVNELMSVGGIGEKKMAKMARWVKVG